MTSGTRGTVPSPGSARPSARTGAICGLITAAVAMGVAQLIAGLATPQASPVVDVGQAVIGGTPLPVKDWATATFGTNDKTFLVGGVLVLLFAFAAVIGVIAVRRMQYGMSGLGVFAVIGLAAVLTRPDATATWIWPTLFGAAAGAVALSLLVKNATQAAAEQAARWEAARPLPPVALSGDAADGEVSPDTGPAAGTGPRRPPPGRRPPPTRPSRRRRDGSPGALRTRASLACS